MFVNVNCQYCGKFYQCNNPKQKKLLGIFKRQCGFVGSLSYKCDLQEQFPKPNLMLKGIK